MMKMSPTVEEPTHATMEKIFHWGYGVVIPAICSMGALGNIINLIVLSRPDFTESVYTFLTGKAIEMSRNFIKTD